MEKKWLEWAKELQQLSQNALAYCKDPFDIERFQRIREISVEIMSNYTTLPMEQVKNIFASEDGYQTPKVDIRAFIVKDEKILLVKEMQDGKWSLPGGWADIGLSVYENIIKESYEEAGAKVTPTRVLAIYDKHKQRPNDYPFSVYKIFVGCEFVTGEHIDNIETTESRFFSLDELPELSSNRNSESQIRACYEAYFNENMKVICD